MGESSRRFQHDSTKRVMRRTPLTTLTNRNRKEKIRGENFTWRSFQRELGGGLNYLLPKFSIIERCLTKKCHKRGGNMTNKGKWGGEGLKGEVTSFTPVTQRIRAVLLSPVQGREEESGTRKLKWLTKKKGEGV